MHGVDEILLSFKAMQDTFIHISLMIQIALFHLPFRISLGLELFINIVKLRQGSGKDRQGMAPR